MKLKEMKATEFKSGKKYDFILPVGATEQHGPFAPFGTDTFTIDHIISEVEKLFPEIVILPTIEYSLSAVHRGFPGTVYVSKDTLVSLFNDIFTSICQHAGSIYITSWHYISYFIDHYIKEHLEKFEPAKLVNLDPLNQDDERKIEGILEGPMDEHSGNVELSNMLLIEPDLITIPTDSAIKTKIDKPFETGNLIDKSKTGIVDNHPEWIVNKETGNKLMQIHVNRMRETIISHSK